jgi:predicted transcriptional regulator
VIRTELEYQRSLQKAQEARAHYAAQKAYFLEAGIPEDAAQIALDALNTFALGIEEDIEIYKQSKRGELGVLHSLSGIGRWLISARIAQGLSQKQLAKQLGVSEAQVSRDERNEYHGISVDRAQSILERMGIEFQLQEISLIMDVKPAVMALNLESFPEHASSQPMVAYLRTQKNISMQKAEEIARVLSAVIDSMTSDLGASHPL